MGTPAGRVPPHTPSPPRAAHVSPAPGAGLVATPDSWRPPSLGHLFVRLRQVPVVLWALVAALVLGTCGGLVAMRLSTGTAGGRAAEDLVPRAVRVSTPADAPATAAPSTDLVVHVAGAVGAPGLQRLPVGSRVADAVAAAGGASPGADLGRVNLAAPLADGSQVYVPAAGETIPSVAAPPSGPPRPGGGTGDAQAPVDLNAASEVELEDLPGVGPATAAAIVRYRAEHRFASVDDLLAVPGIGPAKLEGLRERVRV